ncbi:MAG: putative Ig domain-containing protein [Chloroflexota bacterium]
MKLRHTRPFLAMLALLFMFLHAGPSYGISLIEDKQTELLLTEDDHGDLYWAELEKDAQPLIVEQADLRVAAMNELDELGEWGPVIAWPHVPVSAANLPDGRIMTFASNEIDAFPGGQPEFTHSATWDPATGNFITTNHNTHDMFCAHLVMLEDGDVFVSGGRNTVELTSSFDYQTNTWNTETPMAYGRWYPTSVAMPGDQVYIMAGQGGSYSSELWAPGQGWTELTGANLSGILDEGNYPNNWNWPMLALAPNGTIFQAGPTPGVRTIDTSGLGSIIDHGPRPDATWYPKDGSLVVYGEGQILVTGGREDDSGTTAINTSMTMDINQAEPQITTISPMIYPRGHHNAVMLPNGEVLIIGGNTDGRRFNDDTAVLTPEIWNPDTGQWRTLADMAVPRTYHSIALLLPDGRVLSAGGGLSGGNPSVNHLDGQVYSPPYLYNADGSLATRPVIVSAPSVISSGEQFAVNTDAAIASFSLIKMSSTTHQVNTDLRFLDVDFVESGTNSYLLDAHSNPNVLSPGYYMLFAVNAQGTPSVSQIVQVSTANTPKVENLGQQSIIAGQAISIQVNATDPNGDTLTYSAEGLPNGIAINAQTGEISGVVPVNGTGEFEVGISVTDGQYTSSILSFWSVGIRQAEAGTVVIDQADANTWHTVNLQYSYTNPIVVMGPASYDDADPLTIRVNNVTATSFEFQIDEWEYLDGTHGTETISYIVAEEGEYTLPNDAMLIAGKTDSVTEAFRAVSFSQSFGSTPIVLAQVGSVNEATAVTNRIRDVATNQFEIKLEEEENEDDVHLGETIYWIAIEPSVEAGLFEAANTGVVVDEVWESVSFAQTYSTNPILIATMQTHDGGDTSTIRYRNLTSSDMEVYLEEETSANTEIGHVDEAVGYLLIEPTMGATPFGQLSNLAPVFSGTISDVTAVAGETLRIDVEATDPEGDSLTYSATGLPSTVSIDSDNGDIYGTVLQGNAGSYAVTVSVSDGIQSVDMSFNIIITDASGSWVDYADETGSRLVATNNSFEKDTAVGDLNNDGWDDIIVVHKNAFDAIGGQADSLLMNVDGVLTDQTSTYAAEFLSNMTDARDVLIADIDGDGWSDVIVASTFEDPPVLYRNQGEDAGGNWLGLVDESSRLPNTFDTGTVQFCAVTSGDVNGDGHEDIYFTNYAFDGGAKDVLLINDGSGNFTEESQSRLGDFRWSAFGTSVQILDMDGDSDQDILKLSAEYAVDPWGHPGLFTLFNDGTGHFPTYHEIPTSAAYMMMAADLNNDGLPDIYIQDDAQDYIALGDSVTADTAVNFTQWDMTSIRTDDHGGNFRLEDIDRDGDLDLGIADVDTMWPPCDTGASSYRKLTLFENDGTGQMQDPFGGAAQVWSHNTFDFEFVDIDRDGNLDIFAAQCAGFAVYMNTAPPSSNQPPILTQPVDQTNAEGSTVSVSIVANDGDGDSLTYSAIGLPAGLSINTSTGEISGSLDFASAGSYLVTVSVTDGSLGDSASFNWTITNTNQAPVVTNPGNQSTEENTAVSLQISASDADGDSLSYSATGLPDGLSMATSTGEINGTPTVIGTFNVTVTVSDGTDSASASFDWEITETPVIESQILYIGMAGNGSVGGVSFADEDIVAYDYATDTWSMFFDGSDVGLAVSGNADVDAFHVRDDGTILMSIRATETLPDVGEILNTDLVLFTPTSTGETTAGTFSMYLDGSDVGLASGGEDITAVYELANGDLIISTVGGSFISGPGANQDEDLLRFSGTYGDATSGTWTLYFDGTNAGMTASTEEFYALSIDENGSDLYFAMRGAFDLEGLVGGAADIVLCEDALTDTCAYSYFLQSSVSGLSGSIDGMTLQNTTSEPPPPNDPPSIVNPGDQTNDEGETVSLAISASDANGDGLSYSATGLPNSVSINSSTGEISGLLTYESSGSYTVTVTVDDGEDTASTTFNWIVNDAEPPAGSDIIYLSSTSGGNLDGFNFQDEDIVAYDTVSGSWSLYFDGSDVGFGGNSAFDTDAFHVRPDGSILISIRAEADLAGFGLVDDSDILLFTPTSTGDTTAGTFTIYFDGSDVGLDSGGEDITAVYETASGDLIISTIGSNNVGTLGTNRDEDLLRFSGTFGDTTAGTWSLYFDGSDVELTDSTEEFYGVDVNEATGDVLMAHRGAFSVTGASGGASDILGCFAATTGANTACSYAMYQIGVDIGFDGEAIDGLSVIRP